MMSTADRASRSTTCRTPTPTARQVPGRARQAAGDHASARSADHREHGGSRRPRGRAQADAAGRAEPPMIGVKPLFSGRSLADGANADFDVVDGRARRQGAGAAAACTTSCSDRDAAISGTGRTANGSSSRSSAPSASPTARSISPPTSPAASVAAGEMGPLSARSVGRRSERRAHLSRRSMPASTRRSSADTPDLLEIALDKPEYQSGETMKVAVTARAAGTVTLNVFTDRLVASQTQDVQPGVAQVDAAGRQRLGQRRLCGRDAAPSARRAGAAHAGPRHRRAMVLRSTARRARSRSTCKLPAADAAQLDACSVPVQGRRACGRRGGAHRGRRRRCRHSQSHQLQAAGAGRLLSRPAPAHRRDPRSLRPADRRHAGHPRPDPLRRRCRRAELHGSRRRAQPPLALYSGIVTVGPTAPRRSHSTSPTSPAPCA